MRITENLLMNGFLQRTARSLSAMTKAQQQISSGKLLERPSDDPIALARSLGERLHAGVLQLGRLAGRLLEGDEPDAFRARVIG